MDVNGEHNITCSEMMKWAKYMSKFKEILLIIILKQQILIIIIIFLILIDLDWSMEEILRDMYTYKCYSHYKI